MYSYASCHEDSRINGSSGQGMGKIGENFGVEPDESQKKDVIDEARTTGAKVHFASLMDICHLENAELETKHQKYKGRVVLRCHLVKNDSGSYALFYRTRIISITNDSSKSHGLSSPDCQVAMDKQQTQYQLILNKKMQDAHKLLTECPEVWIRLPRQKWPKS